MNKNKTGRKATAVNEITDRNFTIVDFWISIFIYF